MQVCAKVTPKIVISRASSIEDESMYMVKLKLDIALNKELTYKDGYHMQAFEGCLEYAIKDTFEAKYYFHVHVSAGVAIMHVDIFMYADNIHRTAKKLHALYDELDLASLIEQAWANSIEVFKPLPKREFRFNTQPQEQLRGG